MLHWNLINESSTETSKTLLQKASGRYFTGELVGRRLAKAVCANLPVDVLSQSHLSVADPFGGDGRLVYWLIDELLKSEIFQGSVINVDLWDVDPSAFDFARQRFSLFETVDITVNVCYRVVDTFTEARKKLSSFDVLITNPPWELLKPDRRELASLPSELRTSYIAKMRHYDSWLAKNYPCSQPPKKFAGWGTNLSRVGLELSIQLTRGNGVLGIILPASILADGQSEKLRKSLLDENRVMDIAYFPAEAKLYGKADVESVTIVAQVGGEPTLSVELTSHGSEPHEFKTTSLSLDREILAKNQYILPFRLGGVSIDTFSRLASEFPTWDDWEKNLSAGFWAGRELDETGIAQYLSEGQLGGNLFVKGRMIDRFQLRDKPQQFFRKGDWRVPWSVSFPRIVWRDVSRPNQKRRIISTIIPSGWVAGNSLGVAFVKCGDVSILKSILGIMSSTVFEAQLRGHLATGHLSLGSMRKVAVPQWAALREDKSLSTLTQRCLDGEENAEFILDAYVAKRIYFLSMEEYKNILGMFPKLSIDEVSKMEVAFSEIDSISIIDKSRLLYSESPPKSSEAQTEFVL